NAQGPGNATNYAVFNAAVNSFENLSDVSTVRAIGIGTGVNEEYLKFFDNTDIDGTGFVQFGEQTDVIANFNSNSGINRPSNWDQEGNGSLTRTNSRLNIQDEKEGGSFEVTSPEFDVNIGTAPFGVFSFDYSTTDFTN